ncbi:1-acyl-sn-glycerol-3-phosphate acyltransferase [Carboxylicivirga sp. A043]|uniref:lysophospholipid acyltransferase family protein n=1 Tax=Carboxylicivirga litoralis TaxID=2816963 RepID=UPI0021CB25CB|nr:lysophospholipid acyltransferase family protein [Carboxylicivirga sp. A043]MCU4155430.1 1-acyl-sn-glycerol-3-phosphate acyltransferase [Carboxylicivirga sp. A043]
MKKILGYIFTPIFHLYFGLVLVIFHLPQVIAHKLFGDNARRKVVDTLNYFLVKGLYLMGCRIKFSGFDNLPEDRPIVIVSNHQSLYDIPAVVHGFRKHYPKFISKIELGKNLPSISYNLVHGKSALIDRANGSQSIKEIFKLGRLIQANNYAACIFPEGTRSKNGRVKQFKTPGINTLLRAAPDAVIVPFVIDGHSRMMYKGMFPLKFGEKISYKALAPIEPKGKDIEQLVADIQLLIKKELNQ